MTQLNIVDKAAVAVAIQELYISTRKFNIVGGKAELSMDRFEDQLELVKAEVKEINQALADNNLVEIVDGALDIAITACELIMCIDGNTSLLEDKPLYLNSAGLDVVTLIGNINSSMEDANYIDVLNYTEDLIYQINASMVENCEEVCASNLSKFLTLTDLHDSDYTTEFICKDIESKGRYANVYTEEVAVDGTVYVVFKSKFDMQNNENYPVGKILKCPLSFKEPVLVVFDE